MKEGWERKKIKDISVLIADGDWIESKHQSDEGIRLIQTGNIGNGVFKAKEDKLHYISEYTFDELGCTEIFSGDCLVSRLPEPVGRACLIPEIGCRMITAVDCSIIRFKEIILPKLFIYYTQSATYNRDVSNLTTGTTRKRISRKNLESILIPIPPLEEQERIVEELDCLSGVIEKKKQQLKELDAFAQSIFYEMFGNPDVVNKDWEDSRLEDLCIVITKGTTPTTLGYKFTEAGINFLKVESFFKDGTIDIDKVVYISNECHEVLKRSSLQEDDILLCIAGATVGRLAKVPKHIVPANTNQAFAIIRLKEEKKDLFQYIYFYLHSPFIQNIVTELKKGVAQPNLTLGQVRNFKIVIPPKEIRISFVEKIGLIENEKKLIKKSIEEVEMLFNSRMDYYFG